MKYSVFNGATLSCALVCVVGLSGCGALFGQDGYFRDRGDDYLKAGSIPPMQVPDNVDEEALGQLYEVPRINRADYEYPEEFTAPRPEALSSNVYSENVKIQSLGEQRWIFINASPSEVWPRVRNFLDRNGLQVSRTDPPRGLIETAWLNFKDDPDLRDKYLLRIEQGIQPDSAEIHVTHLSVPRESRIPEQVNWPERSSDAERESWMVDELATSLAGEIGSASASLLAQTIGGDQKIDVVSEQGEPVLRMELEKVRALASLNHALQQEGLQIVDQDSTEQIYYVHYDDPEEDEGWFRGWFGGEGDEQYSLDDLLSHMNLEDTAANRQLFPAQAFEANREPLEDAPGYLIVIRESDEALGIGILVRDAYGQPLPSREAREFLGLVRRNLI